MDALVRREYSSLVRLEMEEVHFQQIRDFVKGRFGAATESLDLYRLIWEGERVQDHAAQAYIQLKLSGLVKRDGDGLLMVRNPIYRDLYNGDWIDGTEPMQALKKIKGRYRRVKTALWLVSAAALILLVVFGFREWRLRQPIHTDDEAYWVEIKPGGFCMGSLLQGQKLDPRDPCAEVPVEPDATAAEAPPHWVEIRTPFRLARYETTIEEFERFVYDMGRRPPPDYGFGEGMSDEQRNKLPVVGVSWQDAKDYADWVSRKTGKHYRLPTEAEWEHVARAGTETPRPWLGGLEATCSYANVFDQKSREEVEKRYFDLLPWEAFPCGDGYPVTAPVGSIWSNDFDVYDMLGNVWEWTEDCWHDNYQTAPENGAAWLEATEGDCGRRVIRGGSWGSDPVNLRSAGRYRLYPGLRLYDLGFRLAQDL